MATDPIGFDPQVQITDPSKYQQPHTEALDLVTIRPPRPNDVLHLETRDKGFLPVHIGDLLKDGAYRILHRIGSGVHSVVWLAETCSLLSKPRYVAIKIFSAYCDERQFNSGILKTLISALQDTSYPSEVKEGLHHLVKPLDQFAVPGPTDSEHVCTVMELVGPCVSEEHVRESGQPLHRPALLALASQVAKALSSLHYLGIVHGDIQPNNIALRFPFDIETLDVKEVYGTPEAILPKYYTGPLQDGMFNESDEEESDLEEEYRKHMVKSEEESDLEEEYEEHTAKVDENTIPRYYVLSPDLAILSSACLQSRPPSFQLIDFTCSFRYTHGSLNPEAHIGTPLDYAPPEAHLPDLLRHLYSPASDMWSFGCVLFQLFHGQVLFDTYTLSNRRFPVKYNFDVIRSLGKEDPIPEVFHKALLSCLPQMNWYSTGIQKELLEKLGEFYEKEDWPREFQNLTYRGKMRERLVELREKKMSEEEGWEQNEVDVICNIIEGCVKWDPEKRLTAKQVVEMLENVGIRG